MRLDLFLTENHDVSSRTRASNLITLGRVQVNGKVITKVAYDVNSSDVIEITENYEASLGGIKLKEALTVFNVDCCGKVCIDVGASNGGFTDVLLQTGASKVYAVDVGVCALPDNLKNNSKVVVMDNTNARFLAKENFEISPEVAVIDVSFISLKLILPSVFSVVSDSATVVALIKPQFECTKKDLSKKGILIDKKKRDKILSDIEKFCIDLGWKSKGIIPAPHPFENKNQEYLICLENC